MNERTQSQTNCLSNTIREDSPLNVLVVDDDDVNRWMISTSLKILR